MSAPVHPGRTLPPVLGAGREAVAAYFDDTWALSDALFRAVGERALAAQPDPLRNPLIFYLGHTAAFYVNKLCLAGLMADGVVPQWETLFAKGVDPHSAAELDTPAAWPSPTDTWDYRERVRRRVTEAIAGADWPAVLTWDHPLWALAMALEHDRVHFETSSVLVRQLPVSQLRRPQGWSLAPQDVPAPAPRWIGVSGATVQLGRGPATGSYGWDNEYGAELREVPAFEARATPVTHQEMAAFTREGGYTHQALWTDAGWRWLQSCGRRHPRFWSPTGDGGFVYRAVFEELPLPMAWPAEVNHHEAVALSRWVGGGARLLTEAEWAVLSEAAPRSQGDVLGVAAYNLNLRWGSPAPVGADPLARTAAGFDDVHGNVWQWLADPWRPFPGFVPHPLYDDFSAPYWDDQHIVMRGGSWASTGTSASRYFRNWFRPHFYQHAGVRLARDAG